MKRHPPPIKDSWQFQDSFSIIHFIMQGHLFSFEVSSTQMITCFSRAEHHLFFLLNFFLDSLPLLFSLPSFQSMNNISYTKERTLRVSTKSVRQHKIPMKDQPTIALLYKFFYRFETYCSLFNRNRVDDQLFCSPNITFDETTSKVKEGTREIGIQIEI